MMENMNEMTNMEIANEATMDLVETNIETGSSNNTVVKVLGRALITIGVWEGGKRIGKWGYKKVCNVIAKAEESKRIKQAKKIESEEVIVTDAVEDIEKTHPIE